MGNCLGQDVKSKYEVGKTVSGGIGTLGSDAEEAVCMLDGALAYCSWLDLHFECHKLRDADMFSKSDAMVVLQALRGSTWEEAGRTEMIANNLAPSFVKRVRVLYNFERVQRLRAVVVDVDKGQKPERVNPAECNFLGSLEFVLSDVATAPGRRLSRTLAGRDGLAGQSRVVVSAEEVAACKDVYTFQIAATNLRNVERFSKSDPFLQISRQQEDGSWLPVYKTAVRRNDLNPVWGEVLVRAAQLNSGDMLRPLRLQALDYEASGSHHPLGWAELSTERLAALAADGGSVPLQPPPGKPPGDYGALKVVSFACSPRPSFLDYLHGGTEVGFVVAVDFTASNGDPRQPGSKHYLAGGPTQYEQAIMGIGRVLEHYDADRRFPLYGFGGQYQRQPTDHCFALGECVGVEGLLAAYRQALSAWSLSGPTLFAPTIRRAADLARATLGRSPPHYTCLLILTDGAIMDMAETVSAIIEASKLPLSILIVGIGNDDFGKMDTLDADNQRLTAGGRTACRDIVQFVPFSRLAGDGAALAAALLAELPGQLLEYMRLNNIPCPQPLPAIYSARVPRPGPQPQAHQPQPPYEQPPGPQQPVTPAGYPYPSPHGAPPGHGNYGAAGAAATSPPPPQPPHQQPSPPTFPMPYELPSAPPQTPLLSH